MSDTERAYRGQSQGNGGTGADDLRPDELEILAALHLTEQTQRPGMLVLYFNGSNWMMYDSPRPRWLPRQA